MPSKRNALSEADARALFRKLGQEDKIDALARPSGSPNSPVSADSKPVEPPKPKKGKKRGEPNKAEREFGMMLDQRVKAGEIHSWRYEAVMLRFGESDAVRYSPDFAIFKDIGGQVCLYELVETKGAFIRPIDLLRFRSARNAFPFLKISMWQKREDGSWHEIL